ncbi:MAG: glycosyltransferase [Bacteroidota bacterium]
MKVTHVIHSIDRIKGGPSTCMQLLTGKLAEEMEIEVVTLKSQDPIALSSLITVHSSPQPMLGLFGYSPGLSRYLEKTDTNLFHGNGLWQYPVHTMANAARKRKVPYILSTHGMLEPWSMTQGKLKKQLAMKLFQEKDLQQANVIHCTAHMEAETIRGLGFTPPIAIIPNGIDTDEFAPANTKPTNQKRKALFLSRIHHKKGLEQLIRSWSLIEVGKKDEWEVEIVGNGEAAYIEALNALIREKKLEEEIRITDPVFGEEKIKKYQEASLFVLPTHSENFGIVVAEALACGVPVITTKGAPWAELNEKHCGWWIENELSTLKETLESAISLPDQVLTDMGKNGRALVLEKYSIQKVAEQMLQLYSWILGKGDQPEFVV